MLTHLLPFLLAPLGIFTLPTSSSLGQLVIELTSTSVDQLALQLPESPTVKDAAPVIAPSQSCMVRQLYQFHDNDDTRLENLAARPNGKLILNVVTKPILYELDPSVSCPKPKTLHTFTGVTSVLGIDEIAPDVFAVVVGNFTDPKVHQPGSFSVWSLNLTSPKRPNVTLITALPDSNALNGLATLPGTPPMIMIADSQLGALWRVNTATGNHTKIFESCLLANTTPTNLGINGIRIFQKKLYFFNSAQGTYGRVPLHDDGSAAGEVEILARIALPQHIWDDFDMDWEGNAWVATHRGDLMEITVEGRQRNTTVCTGIDMLDPTSARFGRGSKKEENTLYVTTAGNKDGSAQVLAVDVCQM